MTSTATVWRVILTRWRKTLRCGTRIKSCSFLHLPSDWITETSIHAAGRMVGASA
jgi:hypothetical protein